MVRSSYTWRQYLRDYRGFLEGKRLRFLYYTFFRSIAISGGFIIAYLLGRLVDYLIAFDGLSWTTVYWYVGGIALAGAGEVWLRMYGKTNIMVIAAEVRKEQRLLAIHRIMQADLATHEEEETGSKMQKVSEGGERVYGGIHDFVNAGIQIIIQLIIGILIFTSLSWTYLAYVLVYILVYLLGESYFNDKLTYWQERLNRIKEKVSGKVHESVVNLLTVKSLGLQDGIASRIHEHEQEYYETSLKTRSVSVQKTSTIKSFAAIGYAGFVLLLAWQAVGGVITVGSILTLSSYFGRIRNALDTMTNNMGHFIKVKAGVSRFMSVLSLVTPNETGEEFPKEWKDISFDGVSFKYRNTYVLRDVDLVIRRGERIGLVGMSGSGKSTIVKLILRLYEPTKGRITVDGKDIQEFSKASLLRNVAVVLQESEMFNMSLGENVTISAEATDTSRLAEALQAACLGDLIAKLPYGLDTLIGEKGYRVSGGERQRIGIARALYKGASVLVLDEATSQLDSGTEKVIQAGIDATKCSALIVAHRLSTLRSTDRIVVLERGRIAEEGSFSSLVRRKGGRFATFYALQRSKA